MKTIYGAHYRKMFLQRFADEDIVDVDDVGGEGGDDEDIIVEHEDHEITPPPRAPMPSMVGGESWRNLEELLVTLSNNVRVGMGEIRDDIKKLLQEVRETGSATEATLNKLGLTMDEFKTLLAEATVETDVPPAPEREKDEKPKSARGGYLSRRRRA